jgi:Family of unknown function (DUF5681)
MSWQNRKPPVEHRFKKGQSGNPKGRPKKNSRAPGIPGGGIFDRIGTLALEEASRPLTVREGNRTTSLPAIQALLRSMFVRAAGGDAKAQRDLLGVVARAEAGRASFSKEVLEKAMKDKVEAEEEIERHEREGLPPPQIYPHPDDMRFDPDTGEVFVDGPRNALQAGSQKVVFEQAVASMKRYFEVKELLESDPANAALKKELKELQKYMDFVEVENGRRANREASRLAREELKKTAETEKQRPTATTKRK